MFDRDTWQFINTFAPWVAGLGTLLAVYTALKLARRESRLLAQLSCHLQFADLSGDRVVTVAPEVIEAGELKPGYGSKEWTKVVSFDIANVGHRPVVVNGVYWKLQFLWKPVYLDFFPFEEVSSDIPERLEDYGDYASYRMTLEQFESYLTARIVHNYTGRLKRRVVTRSAKAGCKTTVGQNFEVRIDRELRERLHSKLSEAPSLPSREPRVSA